MRILVSDYSGHPFQVQLSRSLARRGHDVRHIYSSSFQTPKGNLVRQEGDAPGFSVQAVSLRVPFQKDSFVKRRQQEIEIGQLIAREVLDFAPHIVISSNAPLDTQRVILDAARKTGAKFVFWLQDIYSEAIRRVVPQKMPVIGHAVGAYYQYLEFDMLKKSDHVVSIAEDFVPILTGKGVARDRVSVIENWAPLDEIVPTERDNPWSRENMPHQGLRVVYSGTIGYKHNPQLLIDIARTLDGHVYVFSEGKVAGALEADARQQGVENLSVRPWVPFEDLPKMLSAADIFVAMIEKDAGIFSVPSKVLTYLCVGRPIVAAIPDGNLARTIIEREGAGVVADPGEVANLLERARPLFGDATIRDAMGARARAHAERAFDVEGITDRFEAIRESLRT